MTQSSHSAVAISTWSTLGHAPPLDQLSLSIPLIISASALSNDPPAEPTEGLDSGLGKAFIVGQRRVCTATRIRAPAGGWMLARCVDEATSALRAPAHPGADSVLATGSSGRTTGGPARPSARLADGQCQPRKMMMATRSSYRPVG